MQSENQLQANNQHAKNIKLGKREINQLFFDLSCVSQAVSIWRQGQGMAACFIVSDADEGGCAVTGVVQQPAWSVAKNSLRTNRLERLKQ